MPPIPVMVNGLPGSMALAVARHILADNRFEMVPCSLTGPEITETTAEVDGVAVTLLAPAGRSEALEAMGVDAEKIICVDFTHPSAVNENAVFYREKGVFFVMGTTGGDREKLVETVRSSSISAVIAPNMAKQIVGFQAMMAYAAENFPGLFDGYRLRVVESHQQGKADTSGTAKAVVDSFKQLGVDFSVAQIEKERNPEVQKRDWKIPEQYLSGHGWHTYSLVSADGTVFFSFTHNVNGREVYARGTLDAVAFLAEARKKGQTGRVYSMIEVLKGG
ncbi:MAG: dihydrodipicolinate reductase [Desulfobacterales bacterium]|nr:dihydrodipicolinate reductase [Desulfobacterales bacterium]